MPASSNPTYLYTVEKGVPIPPPRRGAKGNPDSGAPKYPFKVLDVGDSFFVPAEDTGIQGWQRINSAINSRQQRSTMRYCWRYMETHDGTMGYRVWRTE